MRRIRRLLHRLREIVDDAAVRGLWFAALAEMGYRRVLVREFVFSWDIPDIVLRAPEGAFEFGVAPRLAR